MHGGAVCRSLSEEDKLESNKVSGCCSGLSWQLLGCLGAMGLIHFLPNKDEVELRHEVVIGKSHIELEETNEIHW